MKKIITILMTLIFTFSLIGCAPKENNKENNIDKPTSNTKTEEKSENDSPAGEKNITLCLMYKSPFIDVAIKKFQALHPNIKIEVKNAIQDMNDLSNYEKYVKTVNAEIMAGKGSDIICMRELPYTKYVNKKLLVNISELISQDKDFNMKNYNENIINAFKYNGAIYTLPINYSFPIFAGCEKILNEDQIKMDDKNYTWKDLISIGEKVTKDKNKDGKIDQYGFTKMDNDLLIEILLTNQYNKFIDEDKKQVKFDSKEFIDILNTAKELKEKKIMDVEGGGLISAGGAGFQILHTNQEKSAFTVNYVDKYPSLGDKVKLVSLPTESDVKGSSFISLNNFSINKNSKCQKECWEFIKFMLSEEMQCEEGLGGFPVNKAALDKLAKQAIQNTKDKKYIVTETDVERTNQYMSNLSTVNTESMQVNKIIKEEADKFIKGQKTAKQAAETIQNKVSTMINE